MPTLGSRKACGLISCSLPSAWVKYIGSTPALTSMTCSESSSFPAVSMRELNQPSPTSMFRPLKNTMSAVVVFSISAASGVYSCGSTPSGTMLCTEASDPAIFAAISATTENVATIATPSSISASPPTAEVPHALTARATTALRGRNLLNIDDAFFLLAVAGAPHQAVARGEEERECEQHGAGQHDCGARGNVERVTKAIPTTLASAPRAAESRVMVVRRSVRRYAVEAGITSIATTKMMPTVCREATVTRVSSAISR